MSYSTLPLSYCTNVHPGKTVREVEEGLDRYTVKVKERVGELAAGLWLARPVVAELLGEAGGVARFAEGLRGRGLACYTLNAFPYGDFHDVRVKEKVYLPDWAQEERLAYTVQCAQVLAALLEEGAEGSISTLPLGFKGFEHGADFEAAAMARLLRCAEELERIEERTGRRIRLAIEPEPMCILETTGEAIGFFGRLWEAAGGEAERARRYLGMCYDVCHQAVEFEEVGASIRALDAAGIRINKVHLSCALELDRPGQNPEGRSALARFAEPRYLHQVIGRRGDGSVLRAVDLTPELLERPGELGEAEAWRIHFHVPVDAERLGWLGTTRPALKEALGAVGRLTYAPHLEVETYTWEVLPGRKVELVEGLAGEMEGVREMMRET